MHAGMAPVEQLVESPIMQVFANVQYTQGDSNTVAYMTSVMLSTRMDITHATFQHAATGQ